MYSDAMLWTAVTVLALAVGAAFGGWLKSLRPPTVVAAPPPARPHDDPFPSWALQIEQLHSVDDAHRAFARVLLGRRSRTPHYWVVGRAAEYLRTCGRFLANRHLLPSGETVNLSCGAPQHPLSAAAERCSVVMTYHLSVPHMGLIASHSETWHFERRAWLTGAKYWVLTEIALHEDQSASESLSALRQRPSQEAWAGAAWVGA